MTEVRVADRRLRRYARIQAFMAGFFMVAVLGVSVVLYIGARSAATQADRIERLADTNCYNIEIIRLYHVAIVDILGSDTSPIVQQIVEASKTASDAMITTDCQEAQG